MEDQDNRLIKVTSGWAVLILIATFWAMHLAYEKGKAAAPCGEDVQHKAPGQIYMQPDLERNI